MSPKSHVVAFAEACLVGPIAVLLLLWAVWDLLGFGSQTEGRQNVSAEETSGPCSTQEMQSPIRDDLAAVIVGAPADPRGYKEAGARLELGVPELIPSDNKDPTRSNSASPPDTPLRTPVDASPPKSASDVTVQRPRRKKTVSWALVPGTGTTVIVQMASPAPHSPTRSSTPEAAMAADSVQQTVDAGAGGKSSKKNKKRQSKPMASAASTSVASVAPSVATSSAATPKHIDPAVQLFAQRHKLRVPSTWTRTGRRGVTF